MSIRAHALGATALAIALIFAAVGLVEWTMGRPLICTCGLVKLWTGDAYGPENSQMVSDWYSLSHILHGVLIYGGLWLVARRWPIGWRLLVATVIEAGWEIAENAPFIIERYRSNTAALGYSGDSILNSLSDIAMMILGFGLARRLPVGWVIVLGVTFELVSLVAIRDNLTLNVLMLVYPIDAIRVWQAG